MTRSLAGRLASVYVCGILRAGVIADSSSRDAASAAWEDAVQRERLSASYRNASHSESARPKLPDRARQVIRARHLSHRIEDAYMTWVRRFALFHNMRHPAKMGEPECLRLRVQDIDFSRNEVIVRDGKGAKHRITILPLSVKASLQKHFKTAKTVHERNLTEGWGRGQMPEALDYKYPGASADSRPQ